MSPQIPYENKTKDQKVKYLNDLIRKVDNDDQSLPLAEKLLKQDSFEHLDPLLTMQSSASIPHLSPSLQAATSEACSKIDHLIST